MGFYCMLLKSEFKISARKMQETEHGALDLRKVTRYLEELHFLPRLERI